MVNFQLTTKDRSIVYHTPNGVIGLSALFQTAYLKRKEQEPVLILMLIALEICQRKNPIKSGMEKPIWQQYLSPHLVPAVGV